MEIARITVPIDPNATNPNRIGGANRYVQSRAKRAAWLAARSAWVKAGRPKAFNTVVVHLIVRRLRVMDEQNIWAALKSACDGLFVNAICDDDSPKNLRIGHIEQQTGKRFEKNPEVVFIVEEL
jgi:hypothetical protein